MLVSARRKKIAYFKLMVAVAVVGEDKIMTPERDVARLSGAEMNPPRRQNSSLRSSRQLYES
jgi:hypothetical protein